MAESLITLQIHMVASTGRVYLPDGLDPQAIEESIKIDDTLFNLFEGKKEFTFGFI